MQTPKTLTRYIPAGMRLAAPDDLFGDLSLNPNRKKNRTKKKPSDLNEEPSSSLAEESFTVNRTHRWIEENEFQQFPHADPSPEKMIKSVSEAEITPPKIICKNKSLVLDDFNPIGTGNSIFEVDVDKIELPSGVNVNVELDDNFELAKTGTDRGLNFKTKILQKLNQSKNTTQTSLSNVDDCNDQSSTSLSSGSDISQSIKPKCDNLKNKEHWWKNNILFDEVKNGTKVKKGLPLLKTDNINKQVKLAKEINNDIIVYGLFIPKPINSLQNTFFDENVQKALESMDFSIKPMQSYMWPAILRGLNVFMIGPQKCGKTLSYVPALTTFAMDISEKYEEFSIYSGPLILIICTDSDKCKEIYCIFNNLIENSSEAPRVEMLTNMSLMQDCDILVAAQSDLEKCIKSEMITLKRVCHLVLEDADVLLKNNSFMPDFLKNLNEMQLRRPHNRNIQVIATAKKWSADLHVLNQKLYTSPIVCLQDFLQAAIFSNIDFKKKKLNAAHKRFHLEDILKRKYATNKTIVFCKNSEVAEITEYLEMKGIECISITDNLLEDEIVENADMWCCLTAGRFKVFLCTDELFKKTKINTATWLIHYSAPADWVTFQQRFKSLGDSMTCPLSDENYREYDICDICSYLFMAVDKKTDSDIFNDFFNELISSQIHYFKL